MFSKSKNAKSKEKIEKRIENWMKINSLSKVSYIIWKFCQYCFYEYLVAFVWNLMINEAFTYFVIC